jgi:hypothetical protein
MKKISFLFLVVALIATTHLNTFGQASLPDPDGPKESPEQRRCPDGKIRTVCEPHDYLGCGDIKGCA